LFYFIGLGSGGSSGKSAGKKAGLPKPPIQTSASVVTNKTSSNIFGSGKVHAEDRNNYKPPHLTVELLYR
jgi:hypothetical protein